ncbi:MAG TPA: peroxiredoxin [Candidatus Dormibacteraeota bacterium]|jgi:peroxiredoxin Q/BCP|nr:peroxiredoxin [Candidatus Dormibacteraeota bacterium]
MALAAGDTLPTFDLATGGGGRASSAKLAGHRAVLYFYPKDDTTGCTLEAREFTRLVADFKKRGVALYGVSPDSEKSHDRFTAKCDIGFPLISDPDRSLCDAFGVWVEKAMYGRKYMGVERATFLVGADGRIERVWRKVKPSGHAAEVLAAL